MNFAYLHVDGFRWFDRLDTRLFYDNSFYSNLLQIPQITQVPLKEPYLLPYYLLTTWVGYVFFINPYNGKQKHINRWRERSLYVCTLYYIIYTLCMWYTLPPHTQFCGQGKRWLCHPVRNCRYTKYETVIRETLEAWSCANVILG